MRTISYIPGPIRTSHLLIFMSVMMMSVRLSHFVEDNLNGQSSIDIGSTAQAEAAPAADKATAPAAEKPATVPVNTAAPSSTDSVQKTPETAPAKSGFDLMNLDENQGKVLQALAERQNEVHSKAEKIEVQQKLLEISEKKLQDQLKDLKKIKEAIDSSKHKLTKEEEEMIKKTVQTYEAMKPQQAADIFNKLDLSVLLPIIKGMNQRKVSAIMGIMEVKRAREITAALIRPRDQVDDAFLQPVVAPQELDPTPVAQLAAAPQSVSANNPEKAVS